MSKLFTVQTVANELCVCTETIYRMLWAGKLRGTRYPFGWRITEADLQSYLAEGECPADDRQELAAVLHAPRKRNRGFVVVGNDVGSAFAWSLLGWFLVTLFGGQLL